MYGYLESSTYSKRSLTWLKSVNWGLGIVVHRFRLLFEFDQLAEGYFTIYYYYVLYNHEQGTGKFSRRPVSHGSGVFRSAC